ncbi:small conductance mechanosensitive channel [Balneicella halophila]|uniref:Small conductance mechanosensitive channel n=1 Tax=Balneicella halophila TaxID=1537566 RepID=A0A7L4US27_BALHA|nr:mechanosensitive ion channel family protein [Balneicella halophila]PVX52585.1 small conductance mechanosensitive channel [Balneicella halophila]
MDEQMNGSWEKLMTKLEGWLDTLITNTPNIILAIAVFTLSYFLSRLFEKSFRKYLKRFIKQTSIRNLAANILSIITLSLGLFLALAILNLDEVLKTILASAGVAGLAIGLALQGTLTNTFSGISLALNEVVHVGDWIDSNGFSGEVLEINLRSIKVKEGDNNIVVIPNKLVLQSPFKNYGLNSRIRTDISCGVHYDSDLEEVRDIAIATIKEIFPPNPLEDIEFYYQEFADSSINFKMRFWINGKKAIDILKAKSEAIIALKKAFDKNDIEIPFPIRTLISQPNEVEKE